VKEGNKYFKSIDDILFNFGLTTLVKYPAGKANKSYIVPDSVKTIGVGAFNGCKNLTSIDIPENVTTIGTYAFYGCSSLTNIIIPGNVTTIGNSVFCDCSSMKSITIPDKVTTIGSYAFSGCTSLTKVTISDSVTTIGNSVFTQCSSLTSINIPDSVTTIGNSAFSGCTSLTNITIPDSVTTVGTSAFYGCSSLTNVIISDALTTIGNSVFGFCSSLTNITIPDGVTTIDGFAFRDCSSLTNITIPDSVTTIGTSAFRDCSSLSSVFYQGSRTISQSNVFDGCSSLSIVCVSPGYKDKTFCGKAVNSTSDICKEFRSLFSHCYEGACIDGKLVEQKRKNATELESSMSHGCVQYQCQNDTGKLEKTPQCEEKDCYNAKCNETSGVCEYDKNEGWEPDNHCYEVICENNEWKSRKKKNATEWENQISNECIQYKCDNETGANSLSLCDEQSQICVNNQCVDKKTPETDISGISSGIVSVNCVERNTLMKMIIMITFSMVLLQE